MNDVTNIKFSIELPNCINNIQINININTLKSHCINLIILSPCKKIALLVYPKFILKFILCNDFFIIY
jgi:hypothetical protein